MGGQSLFIIHYSVSSNLHAMPLIKRVWFDDQQVTLRLKVTRGGFNEVLVSESEVGIASLLPVSVPLEKK